MKITASSWPTPMLKRNLCFTFRAPLAITFTSFLVLFSLLLVSLLVVQYECQSYSSSLSSSATRTTGNTSSQVRLRWQQQPPPAPPAPPPTTTTTVEHVIAHKPEQTDRLNFKSDDTQKRKLSTRSLRNNGQPQVASTTSTSKSGNLVLSSLAANLSSSCLPNEPQALMQPLGPTNGLNPTTLTSQEDLLSSGSSSWAALIFQQQKSSFGFTQTRASEFVKPNFYTLRLKLDPEKRKFGGQLMVSVDLLQYPPTGQQANGQEQLASAISSGTSQVSLISEQQTATNNQTSVRYLTLHAGANLSIKKAFYVFTSRSNIQIPATRIGRNLTSELLTLDFYPNSIPLPSQGLLLLVYNGQVNDTESHGLFLHKSAANLRPPTGSSGSGAADPFVAGLATHMEPSFARRLFPSWDEPHLKARFSLIVVLPFRGYESISNMPIKRKSISLSCSGEPLQEVEFHTTPTMSTYLLALVVGKFEHIESITPNNCKVRAYFYANQTTVASAIDKQQQQQHANAENQTVHAAPPASVNMRRRAAQMALDFAVRSFDYLESALGVKYPLPKFDMIALRDFNSGGMENWGASLFHENYLLCDNHNQNVNIRVNGGSNRPKRLVVPLVVAHEIVHQWFGNLLTARTWTHLWLNEGFAQLLMYEVAQALLPAEPYWHIFIEDNRRSSMAEDELVTSSRALELGNDVDLLDQETQLSLFDQLTYNKGAMVVRMVQFALGPREFLAGLRHYLLKHAYDSVSSHDLWAALEESATGRGLQDRQLESSMASWLQLEGFPLLRVRVSESPDGHHYKLDYSQERFTLLPAEAATWQSTDSTSGTSVSEQQQQQQQQQGQHKISPTWANWLWSIPVTIASELTPKPSEPELRLWAGQNNSALLISDKAGSVVLARSSLGAWFKLNHLASGYFRVDYEPATGTERPIDMLARMAPAVRDQTMAPIDRYNLLEDLFSMVLAGRKPLVVYLRYLDEAYSQEHELLVLRFIFDSLERIRAALVTNSPLGFRLERSFDQYVQQFVRKLIGAFKAAHDGRDKLAFRATAAAAGSASEHEDTQMSHQALFSSQTSGGGNGESGGNRKRRRRRASSSDDVALTVGTVGAANKQHNNNTSEHDANKAADRCRRRRRRASLTASSTDTNAPHGELLELFDSIRLVHNNEQLARWANDLLARNFRPASGGGGTTSGTSGTKQTPAPLGALESLGRDLRASIYSAALNYQQQQTATTGQGRQLATNESAEPTDLSQQDYVTSLVRNLEDIWARIRQQGQTSGANGAANNKSNGNTTRLAATSSIFTKLLAAYEFGEASSSERAAIAQALGSTRDPSKQTFLLNVTLTSQPGPVFRIQDASLLLDSLARSREGRKLIWDALNEQQAKLFKQRQLLAAALKSVSRGLIEEPQLTTGAIETQLRQLYVIYGDSELGKLIGQSIEWVRINSLWFKRDHNSLAEFLATGTSTTDD